MDTHTLQAFLAVVETGSFSLAADRLFVTQPAISKRIAALEGELAARLFERLGRRVLLTEAGRTLLPRARHILLEMEDSRREINDLAAEISGVLQLATSHHVGLHRLPEILHQYSLRYPRVEFDLRFIDSEGGCRLVAAGSAELAVVTLPATAPSHLILETIWDDPLAIMVAPNHPFSSGQVVFTEMASQPAILPEVGTVTRRLIEEPFSAHGVQLRIGLETNYLETIRMLVVAGLGWSVLPMSMYMPDLRVIDLPGIAFFRRLGIVRHERRTMSRAARVFCAMLREACPDRV